MIVAIQPDNYGANDASSPIWTRLLIEAGHQVREVDVYRADILEQLQGCGAFMWRHAHVPEMRQVARRLLPVIERELGLAVYPDQHTCWHYDDKIAQAQLLEAAGIASPRSWVWYDRRLALQWAQSARYPMVLKLWAGAGSTNVRLVESPDEAQLWIKRLFGKGIYGLGEAESALTRPLSDLLGTLRGREAEPPWELHKNYVLFQEFLPDNPFDTRITVIGNRAFGFRRFNRENDFRASGSGVIDYDPRQIDPAMVRLAFDAACRLKMQSCAIDGLWRGGEPVISELSYTYASWAVHDCPGHWDADLNWHEGAIWPEQAQIEDFLARLKARSS